jgi:hypothetical protein
MFRSLCAVGTVLVFSSSAFAQTTTGTIQGRVTDASGSVVPQAKIVIQNDATGIQQVTQSGSEGNFVLPYVPPGVYTVTAEKEGFDRSVTTVVRLNVQQTVALDITMKIGNVATTVEVTASAVQLSTSTSSVATVIQGKAILDLPLNGRNPFALANLTPGVIPASNNSGSTPWISGGRNASSEITIDGTSVILPENNVSINQTGYTPIVDSIAEFNVISNAMAAEYGRTGGGVINVATRSGTNDFHGSLFEFLRNSKLDANSWANNRNGVRRAAFQRNQFGGTFGGPISIPKLYDGKNRTFFFFAEQSTRTRNASTAQGSVPIDAWRQGDFSDLRNGNGQLITLYDPNTVFCESACDTAGAVYARQPFPGNRVPVERFDPVARNLLKYWPQPNARPTNQFTQQNNFFASGKSPSRDDKFDSRIDHHFSDKFRVYGRGSYGKSSSTGFNAFGNIANSLSGNGFNSSDSYNISLNAVYTFSPTTIMNVNYGFARQVILTTPFSQGIDLTTLGFSQAVQAAAAQQNLEFPDIQFSGNTNVSKLGQATFTTLDMRPYSHIVRPDVTKVFSSHTIKFGAEFRKMFMNFRQHGQPSGSYSFNAGVTQRVLGAAASQTQGSGFASFLLGIPASGNVEHTFAIASASEYYGLYLQDDWKLSRRLTLNIGLRYDVDVPRTERYNRLSYFDIDAPSPIAGRVPGLANLRGAMRFATPDHRRQTPTDFNNWGPRFGFALQVTDKSVFRGAYGILYSGSALQAAGTSGSSGTEGFTGSTNMIVSNNGGRTFEASLNNPFPSGFNFPLGAAEGPISGANTNLGLGIGSSFFNDYRNPIIQQWNATIQQEFGRGFLVEVGYLGSKGQHLIDGESNMTFNQLPASYFSLGNALLGTNQVANPFYGVITNPNSSLSRPMVAYSQLLRAYPQYTSVNAFRKPQANSLYHSFTLRAEKRFSDGLNMLVSLTAGKLIDDASQTVTFLGEAGTKQDFYNRAAERSISAQDVSRRLVLSGNYELPFGRGKSMLGSAPKVVDFILGGWQLNGIATFQTGVPLKISNGGNNTNLGSPGQRPNNNGKSAKLDNPTMERYFDTSVFSQAPVFTFGNTSRTSPDLRLPAQNNLDASIFKRFRATERATFELRAEAFNATNHPTLGTPGQDVTNVGSFGVITTKSGSRVMQLALKFLF